MDGELNRWMDQMDRGESAGRPDCGLTGSLESAGRGLLGGEGSCGGFEDGPSGSPFNQVVVDKTSEYILTFFFFSF